MEWMPEGWATTELVAGLRGSAITRTDLTDLTRLSPATVRRGGSQWVVSAGLCGQAARAGVGCGLGSGSGTDGIGVGAPGRLAGGWVWWPGWLVGPLSQ